jgi:hypothetical protein
MPEEDRTEWLPVTLPGATDRQIYVEAVPRGGREEVGLLEAIPFEHITELLAGIARGIGDTLEKAKPKKAAVELGVEFGLEGGKLVALIARGTGKANLKISLEWER